MVCPTGISRNGVVVPLRPPTRLGLTIFARWEIARFDSGYRCNAALSKSKFFRKLR